MQAPEFMDESKVGEHGISCLLYGDSSAGKTYVAQTFPSPIYILDTECRAIKNKVRHFKDKEIFIHDPTEYNTVEGKSNDAFDTHKTIENCVRFVLWYANEVKSGRIKGGTVVIDSASDIWSWIQEWMVMELAKYASKDGAKRADVMTMRLANQVDWRLANKRHQEIIGVLKSLLPLGTNLVITARETQPPEYVVKTGKETLKDRIRGHNTLPFMTDYVFNLKKITQNGVERYVAKVEKACTENCGSEYINMLNYDKIMALKQKVETPKQEIPKQ